MTEVPQYCGVSDLRQMNKRRLRKMATPTIVMNHNQPSVVIVPYEMYMTWQETILTDAALERERGGG